MKLVYVMVLVGLASCSSKKDAAVKSEPPPAVAQEGTAPRAAEEVPPAPQLADNAPRDRPVTGRHTPEQQRRIAELSAQAMTKYPDAKARFVRGLPAGEHMFVTTTLTSPGRTESVFVAVAKIANGKVIGTIASDIMNVTGYKAGDRYELPETAITDWMIAKPDGSEEGNVVGKYLDTLH